MKSEILNLLPKSMIPNKIQHYLLLSAIKDPEQALVYWAKLKEYLGLVDLNYSELDGTTLSHLFDKLDSGAARLLPIVYKNLKNFTDDVLLHSIKSYYRYTWARNQYFYDQVLKFAKENPGVDIILLKGLSSAFYYADDSGIRVAEDIDILIRKEQIKPLLKKLDNLYSLKAKYKLPRLTGSVHAATYDYNKTELDIHWGILRKNTSWDVCKYPDSLISIDKEKQLFVLSPSYALFHAMVHGIMPNNISTIRWITDCYLIAKAHSIDWDLVVKLAKQSGYLDSLVIAVTILSSYMEIPTHIVDYVSDIEISQNRMKYWNKLNDFKLPNRSFTTKSFDVLEFIYLDYKIRYKLPLLHFVFKLPFEVGHKVLSRRF
ncbi:MAG: hypothetical protein QG673_2247 [Pseudomonadota bacterium]|jgi:hypothetical protein|nr:nucleotidyltransferase family protein [Burkholderiales bacterium]MDQ5922188.1 hypothetical protein [Pseudomonadota bacterium]